MFRSVSVVCVFTFLLGCQSLSGVKYTGFPDYSSSGCAYSGIDLGRPRTTQGDDLCKALITVKQRQDEVGTKLQKLTDQGFNLGQIGLTVLSVSAVAADSHVSLLEGLGIATASLFGLKSYAGTSGRRSNYSRGTHALQCLDTSSRHLLWNDSSYYRLRSSRKALDEAMSAVAASLIDPTIPKPVAENAATMQGLSVAAHELAQEAIVAYAALGGIIESRRVDIVTKMRSASDSSRGDVDQIVTSILNAERVKAMKINGTEEKAEAIAAEAEANTASTTESRVAVSSTKSVISAAVGSLASKRIPAIKVEDGTDAAISFAASSAGAGKFSATKQLQAALAISAYSIRQISNIAPAYVAARAGAEACVYD